MAGWFASRLEGWSAESPIRGSAKVLQGAGGGESRRVLLRASPSYRSRILASASGGLGTHFVRGLPRQQFKSVVKHLASTLAQTRCDLVAKRLSLVAVRAIAAVKSLVRVGLSRIGTRVPGLPGQIQYIHEGGELDIYV